MISPMSNTNPEGRRKSKFLRFFGASLTLATFCGGVVYAQPKAMTADNAAMYAHIMKAKKIAGSDLFLDFTHRCFIEPLYSQSIAKLINGTAAVEPAKVFDNLYFVGQEAVSSWVLQTSQGLILIDTENNPAEAKEYIEGGMEKLGLDPRQIKYIILTHEHADHFGGSKYLQQKYSAHVIASATAWKNMPTANRGAGLDPVHDMDIADGQKFTLGDTTLTFYVTPGHTDGTISFIVKTTDHGAPHVIGFFGGMGSPRTEVNRDTIINSYQRWRTIASDAGADTLIANHQGEDHAVDNIEFVRVRRTGDPNPFVVGKAAYQRYFEVQEECTKADLARNGQKIPD